MSMLLPNLFGESTPNEQASTNDRHVAPIDDLLAQSPRALDAMLFEQIHALVKRYKKVGDPLSIYYSGRQLAIQFDPLRGRRLYQVGCLHSLLGELLITANLGLLSIRQAEAHLQLALTILDGTNSANAELSRMLLKTFWLKAITQKMQQQYTAAYETLRQGLEERYLQQTTTFVERIPLLRQIVLMEQNDTSYRLLSESLGPLSSNPVEYFHSVRRLFEFYLNHRELGAADRYYREVLNAFGRARYSLQAVHVYSFYKNLYQYFHLIGQYPIASELLKRTLCGTTQLNLHGQRAQLIRLAQNFGQGNDDARLDVAQYEVTSGSSIPNQNSSV
jgi:hypothetical protein